jgi:hypothetical protein
MAYFQVKCITIMEETFNVYADNEKEAINIIDNVLEDPDWLLKEQQVINKSNYRVTKLED